MGIGVGGGKDQWETVFLNSAGSQELSLHSILICSFAIIKAPDILLLSRHFI